MEDNDTLIERMLGLRGARSIYILLICIALSSIASLFISRPVQAVFVSQPTAPIVVNWTPASDESGTYTLCVSDTPGFVNQQCVASVSGASYDAAPLVAQLPAGAGEAYWRVAPVDAAGLVGQWTEPQQLQSEVIPPVVPTNPQIPTPAPPDNDPPGEPPVLPPQPEPNPNPKPTIPVMDTPSQTPTVPVAGDTINGGPVSPSDTATGVITTAPQPILTTGSAARLIDGVAKLTGNSPAIETIAIDPAKGTVAITDQPATATLLPGQESPPYQGAVIDSTPHGWRIYGMIWYLWAVIVGVAVATVLFAKKIITMPLLQQKLS